MPSPASRKWSNDWLRSKQASPKRRSIQQIARATGLQGNAFRPILARAVDGVSIRMLSKAVNAKRSPARGKTTGLQNCHY
jgi:protein tyrosine phosphatase (PTP) superfamily phosphohydrolase (DUF442 family)